MPLGRPLVPLTLTDEQQDQLNGIARSATLCEVAPAMRSSA